MGSRGRWCDDLGRKHRIDWRVGMARDPVHVMAVSVHSTAPPAITSAIRFEQILVLLARPLPVSILYDGSSGKWVWRFRYAWLVLPTLYRRCEDSNFTHAHKCWCVGAKGTSACYRVPSHSSDSTQYWWQYWRYLYVVPLHNPMITSTTP